MGANVRTRKSASPDIALVVPLLYWPSAASLTSISLSTRLDVPASATEVSGIECCRIRLEASTDTLTTMMPWRTFRQKACSIGKSPAHVTDSPKTEILSPTMGPLRAPSNRYGRPLPDCREAL